MKKAVCLLNINKEGILVVSRKEDISKFGMPGGKVEENETELEAIIREVFEETNVSLNEKDLEICFQGYATPEYWTTVFFSSKENLNTLQKEENIIPFFVNKEEFLGEKAYFKPFNNLLFETISLK